MRLGSTIALRPARSASVAAALGAATARAQGSPAVRRSIAAAALAGTRFVDDGIAFVASGCGLPLLLVHDVDVGASAMQFRPVFERLAANRAVYAVDLPGYGGSVVGAWDHTPRFMSDAVQHAAAVVARRHGDLPVDVLAVGTGCEFVARAAVEAPARYGCLGFVAPTGLGATAKRIGTRERPFVLRLIGERGARWLYRRLTAPDALRRRFERACGSSDVDEAWLQQALHDRDRPGAWRAPLQALAGRMASADCPAVYAALTQPVWIARGHRSPAATVVTTRGAIPAQWRRAKFPTGGHAHFDPARRFVGIFEAFLDERRPQPTAAAQVARRPSRVAGAATAC